MCDVGASILNPSSASPPTHTDNSRGVSRDTDTTSTRRGGGRRRAVCCGPAEEPDTAGFVNETPFLEP
jgi:hypothetical protein